jgi:ribonuclease G
MTGISLIESDRLKEYHVEFRETNNLTGNIYKGYVVNVLKGLQSAFVNFGNVRNGFLSAHETLGHKTLMDDSGVMPDRLSAEENTFVMVQATKEEIGNKGARLTTNITLPGRYVVFLPNLDFVGVSAKITDELLREKLTKALEKVKPRGGGFIARTACVEAKKSEILSEVKQLAGLWEQIKENYDRAEGISQIYSDGDFIFRTVRDMLGADIETVYINDRAEHANLIRQLKDHRSKYHDKVKLYAQPKDICEEFGILDEVDRLLKRRVDLKSGVSLIFDHTEALTAVDVNTARFTAGDNHEETVFQANLEAAVEIARQIRLRNIGGIIVVDFIDMEDAAHREAVLEALRVETLYDRTKTRIVGMTPLGLVEITRKKVGRELGTILLDTCPYCHGEAQAYSVYYTARKIKRDLKSLFLSGYTTGILTLSEELADSLLSGGYLSEDVKTVFKDKRIYLVPDKTCGRSYYRLKGSQETVVSVPQNAKLLY